jgi:hypothetical protein
MQQDSFLQQALSSLFRARPPDLVIPFIFSPNLQSIYGGLLIFGYLPIELTLPRLVQLTARHFVVLVQLRVHLFQYVLYLLLLFVP